MDKNDKCFCCDSDSPVIVELTIIVSSFEPLRYNVTLFV